MTRPRSLIQEASQRFDGYIPAGGLYVETKHNGVHASWIDGKLLASKESGHPIGGVEHIAEACRHMERLAGCALFLDAEFIVEGDYLKTLSHIGKDQRAPEAGQIYIFDCLPLDEWKTDNSWRPLCERKKALRGLVEAYQSEKADEWEWRAGSKGRYLAEPPVSFVDHVWCATYDEVCAVYTRVVETGGEGVMIKNPDTPYRRKRSGDWQKWKSPNFGKVETVR